MNDLKSVDRNRKRIELMNNTIDKTIELKEILSSIRHPNPNVLVFSNGEFMRMAGMYDEMLSQDISTIKHVIDISQRETSHDEETDPSGKTGLAILHSLFSLSQSLSRMATDIMILTAPKHSTLEQTNDKRLLEVIRANSHSVCKITTHANERNLDLFTGSEQNSGINDCIVQSLEKTTDSIEMMGKVLPSVKVKDEKALSSCFSKPKEPKRRKAVKKIRTG